MPGGVQYRDRAVYLEPASTLVLADLHVGRDATSDVAFPVGERRDLTGRLEALLAQFSPETVVFAGDVLHSFSEIPRETPETLAALRRAVREAGARLVVTPGNHDTMLASLWDGPTADAHRVGGDEGDTVVCHGHAVPDVNAARYVLGHDHPTITIEGRTHPCYLWGEHRGSEVLMLPAFTRLAAGVVINRMWASDFQSPFVTDANVLRPVVASESSDEVHEFPPLGEFRRLL
ncbi:metallophosphoesterase [Halomarina litorea]|uniref:metallophosphoesterase n=1 Tax=Halomarina litorea TaxID=2961595 RepID=UPI0020C4DAE4|nr:metallophosphoesterase [Halomarina sp. BCD28]